MDLVLPRPCPGCGGPGPWCDACDSTLRVRPRAPSVASITLTMTDGRTVVWGTTDRTDEKAEKLGALLTQPGHTYDVSSPDLPTVK